MTMKTTICLVMMAVLGFAGVATGGPLCRAMLHHPELAEEVGIDESTMDEIGDLYFETQADAIRAGAEARIKRLEIQREMRSDEPDVRVVRKLVGELGDARGKALMARLERGMKMKQLVSPDQLRDFRRLMKENRPMMREGERRRGTGMRRGMRGLGGSGMKNHGDGPRHPRGTGMGGHGGHGFMGEEPGCRREMGGEDPLSGSGG
jgi:hypothetical protein